MASGISSSVKSNLMKDFVYRNQQIEKIVDHLCSTTVSPEPLLVTGPESTGKTSILRKALDATGSVHVYIDCREIYSPKAVYSVIVRKLKRVLDWSKKRKRGSAPANYRGDSMSQFVTQIGDVLKGYDGGTVWIVLDSAERVAKNDVLITLSQLGEVLSADIGIIMVSTMPWVSGVFSTGKEGERMREPDVVEFPAYGASEICKICTMKGYSPRCTEYTKYYEQFVASVVPVLARGTNNLLDIRVALSKLWPVYIAPVRKKGTSVQGPQLLRAIMPMLQNIVSNLDVGVNHCATTATAKEREMGNEAKMVLAIPYMSKFLLLASYIASRNKATSDQAIFDPGYSGKSRKNSQALDRQAERALDKKLRGSHAFPLERMLNIYYYICEPKSVDGFIPKEGHVEWLDKLQEVEVLMQVTSLCSLGLLTCVGGDPLTGPSYRCDLSDDLAYKIARNLKVSLNDYIKLA